MGEDPPGVERTFFCLKPDALEKRLVGEIISRIERKGLEIVGLKLLKIARDQAERLYEEHRGKPFYEGLVDYITSGPSIPMVVEGVNAIRLMRNLSGSTEPSEALPGTIRGDYAPGSPPGAIIRNLVHASDSEEDAEREIGIFFKDEEILRRI
jgi:nucleoside-diphosphate kinase